jgi:hypothetical protein
MVIFKFFYLYLFFLFLEIYHYVPLGTVTNLCLLFFLFQLCNLKYKKILKKKKKDPEAPLIVSKYDEALQQNVTKCVF